MKTPLRPQEYYYLDSPLRSGTIEMLKYTLQGLHADGHLEIFYKAIYINPNERYKRSRLFIKLGPAYKASNTYSLAEKFLLSHFDENALRAHEIRNKIMDVLDWKIRKFKYKYVCNDVHTQGLVSFKWFLSFEARRERKRITKLLDEIDETIDVLLQNKSLLDQKLQELGTHYIFLAETTLTKLQKKVFLLDELVRFFVLPRVGDGSMSFGSISGGGSYSSGGFSGFGGGSFGGGGSGGSW